MTPEAIAIAALWPITITLLAAFAYVVRFGYRIERHLKGTNGDTEPLSDRVDELGRALASAELRTVGWQVDHTVEHREHARLTARRHELQIEEIRRRMGDQG